MNFDMENKGQLSVMVVQPLW